MDVQKKQTEQIEMDDTDRINGGRNGTMDEKDRKK